MQCNALRFKKHRARVHCAVPGTRPGSAGIKGILSWISGGISLVQFHRVTAVMAKGKHPVPFRTRKLSSSAPMVLQGRPCGRVGHRRTYFRAPLGSFECDLGFGSHGLAPGRAGGRVPRAAPPARGLSGPRLLYVRGMSDAPVRRGSDGAYAAGMGGCTPTGFMIVAGQVRVG